MHATVEAGTTFALTNMNSSTLTGMMPILHSPGLMMPGQLGPMRRVCDCSMSTFFTRTMSCCGMPSVMHTIRSNCAH